MIDRFKGIDCVSISLIFVLDFRTVQMVWLVFLFILLILEETREFRL